jgi:TRAP transporter TAXI family solute receptor
LTSPKPSGNPVSGLNAPWRAKGVVRTVLLLAAAATVAGIASAFGIARDYGYLNASILTGSPDGQYYALATRLANRAKSEHGTLKVVATNGSVENVNRLANGSDNCAEKFALIQDGTPVPADARLELLGRLPQPETLLLLGRPSHAINTFADLRGASIGIGPDGSGTAYLMRQLFEDPDLRTLDVHLSQHGLAEQAQLVAEDKLDVAAFVMQEDAELLRSIIHQHGLDIVSPQDLQGLIARYPWLSLGQIPAGRYDLVRPIPATNKPVARLATLVIASRCAWRADRIALLMLLGAELPGFVRNNPPSLTSSATKLQLASEAQEFFMKGEAEVADRYFPWLVNLMSPAYWVYLIMAVTVLFNALRGFSRFRLWRIDAAREKLETALSELVERGNTHAQMQAVPAGRAARIGDAGVAAQEIMARLVELRARCQRQTSSLVTPMGDEMFYRYQQFRIDEATATLGEWLRKRTVQGSLPT